MDNEKWLEKVLKKEIGRLGGELIKLVPSQASGLPDRLCLMPGGIVFFIELKTLGKTLSPLQKMWRRTIMDMGFNYEIINTEAKLKELLDKVVKLR